MSTVELSDNVITKGNADKSELNKTEKESDDDNDSPLSSPTTVNKLTNISISDSESSLKAVDNWGGLGNDPLIPQAPIKYKKKG